MSEVCTKENQINFNQSLYKQYNWFVLNFLPRIRQSSSEFFSDLFSINLLSVSENINILFQGSNYFVTKVRVDKKNDVFIRCSEDAIDLILNEILGKNKKTFSLESITQLEAEIITSFNDYLYENLTSLIKPSPVASQKTKNMDVIHLTFFIRAKGENDFSGGKIILSIPTTLLEPENVVTTSEKFSEADFFKSKVGVKLQIGTTKFPVKELKKLEKEDLVIFENSDVNYMTLKFKTYKKKFQIKPNPGLVISIDNNNSGGNNMTDSSLSQNLWDNIEVEMGAEFDKVKITLGELKNIEQGLVVDLSSVYNNKISLKVEDKVIAKGELVIINDRYGVRIEEVYASEQADASQTQENSDVSAQTETQTGDVETTTTEDGKNAEDFDYSDFELDDEDI